MRGAVVLLIVDGMRYGYLDGIAEGHAHHPRNRIRYRHKNLLHEPGTLYEVVVGQSIALWTQLGGAR